MRLLLIGVTLIAGSTALGHEVIHNKHKSAHAPGDGHVEVRHGDHVDHLHGGHLHNAHGGHTDEHVIAVSAENPDAEAPVDPSVHARHMHKGKDRKHPLVQHGDHFDHLHDGRLHRVHGDHVDDHGALETVAVTR